MNLQIKRDRLRERILRDPDYDVEAGIPIHDVETLEMFMPSDLVTMRRTPPREMTVTFGTLIGLSRRRRKLTVEELAVQARVDVAELVAIEQKEPGHVPKPRTIHQLADFFTLPEQGLMKLSGAVVSRDKELENAAVRFAAKSTDLTTLTRSEEELLNEIVKCLAEKTGEKTR